MSKLRVFMYHKVNDATDFLTVAPNLFKEQITFIHKKYNVIGLPYLLETIKLGKQIPNNAALITFDDGYADNYLNAFPILNQFNTPFTIFLVADFIGKTTLHDSKEQTFLNIEQLESMRPLASYGLHSFKHDSFNDLTIDRRTNK
jgi:peptidoglycan/xylan/chitin deacetylase (PgdA/CDA1 family)